MKWYRNLYLGKGIRQPKEQLIKKVETCAGLPDLYLITLAANGRDLFDVFLADFLQQSVLHGHCPLIVGMARGRRAALKLATDIALDAYRANGNFDIPGFLAESVEAGEEMVYEYPMEKLKKKKRFGFGK